MRLQHQPTGYDDAVHGRGSPALLGLHDRVGLALDLLERHRLSPMELRILLALQGREVSLSELAESSGRNAQAIRRSAGSLYARGLLHWRYAGDESVFSLTFAGRAALRPLRAAALSL